MFVPSERSKGKLVHQGFGFIFDKSSSDGKTHFWRCEKKSHGCKARMHAVAGTNKFIRLINEHDHGSNLSRLDEVTTTNVVIDENLEQNGESSVQLHDEIEGSIRRLTTAIVNKLQNRNDQANKRKRTRSPSNPQFTEKVNIPENFKLFNGERFLLADSMDPQFQKTSNCAQVIIFGKETNQKWSGQMKKVFVSTQSQNIPSPFSTLCILWAEKVSMNGGLYNFPVLYILMENRSETTYSLMFKMIKETWPQFNPESITIDFDKHILNSTLEKFPNTAIHGCFSSMKRKMLEFLEENGQLMDYHSEDSKFGLTCNMVLALSFLPPIKIYDGFSFMYDCFSKNDFNPSLLRWFEEEFIGKYVQNNHQRPPTFASQIWSCHQRVLNYEAITNKNSKIAYKQLQVELTESNQPSICTWIEAIHQLQYLFDLKMEQFMVGVEAEFDEIDECNDKILGLVNGFNDGVMDFLRVVAVNIRVY